MPHLDLKDRSNGGSKANATNRWGSRLSGKRGGRPRRKVNLSRPEGRPPKPGEVSNMPPSLRDRISILDGPEYGPLVRLLGGNNPDFIGMLVAALADRKKSRKQ